MYEMYFEMLKDCAEFCAKAEAFIEKQKEFIEGEKEDGEKVKRVHKIQAD